MSMEFENTNDQTTEQQAQRDNSAMQAREKLLMALKRYIDCVALSTAAQTVKENKIISQTEIEEKQGIEQSINGKAVKFGVEQSKAQEVVNKIMDQYVPYCDKMRTEKKQNGQRIESEKILLNYKLITLLNALRDCDREYEDMKSSDEFKVYNEEAQAYKYKLSSMVEKQRKREALTNNERETLQKGMADLKELESKNPLAKIEVKRNGILKEIDNIDNKIKEKEQERDEFEILCKNIYDGVKAQGQTDIAKAQKLSIFQRTIGRMANKFRKNKKFVEEAKQAAEEKVVAFRNLEKLADQRIGQESQKQVEVKEDFNIVNGDIRGTKNLAKTVYNNVKERMTEPYDKIAQSLEEKTKENEEKIEYMKEELNYKEV